MILLDRPEEAGYFIFSDLSVRHEGRYYLSFALMEEVKDDRDKDDDEPMSGIDEITGPDVGSGRHFQFRTQVQTDVFDVFSAKKFPGLQESTALSRTVAEQGCRVRIRRDVRMRRREKGGKGKEIAARDDEYAQRAKADAAARDRSITNDGNGPYRQVDLQRRPSGMGAGTGNGYHHRPSFPMSEPSPSSRQPPYGHMAPYPPTGRSIPNSPSYPPPPSHAAPYAPRPPYGPYAGERSPPQQHGPPAPPHPRDLRESYSYRGPDPVRGPPMLAPKLELDTEPKRSVLPPINSINGGVPEPRRPSHFMPRLLPQPPPPPPKRDADFRLPPLAPSAYLERPMAPPTPTTPSMSSLSRKRSADQANLAPVDDYRLQHGRRQDEQPRDANYQMQPLRHPFPQYAEPRLPPVEELPQQAPSHWTMSLDLYNRASDSDIPVDFPGLHATRLGGST